MQRTLEQYEAADAKQREAMEKRYGKKTLEQALDEFRSSKYLRQHSQKCPHCGVNISKIDGCNKMHCDRCHTCFCWLCLRKLLSSDPYEHFRSGSCRNKLFDGLLGVEDDPEDEMFEGDDVDDDNFGWGFFD